MYFCNYPVIALILIKNLPYRW